MYKKPTLRKRFFKRKSGRKVVRKVVRKVARKPAYMVAPPPKMKVCLKYTDLYTSTLTNIVPNQAYTYRPNNTFDPYCTGAGHQAMFRDQFFAMYAYARCCAFSVYVRIMYDSNVPVECILYTYDVSAVPSHTDAREYRGTRKGFVSAQKPLVLKMSGLVDRFLENRRYTCFIDDQFKQGPSASLSNQATVWVGLSFNYTGSAGSAVVTFE